MTSEDWLYVGSRLLGIYFVVIGALTAAGALSLLGMELPEGTERWVVMAGPVLHAGIAAAAGVWLLTRPAGRSGRDADAGRLDGTTFGRVLQLLGIVFLIAGATELVKTAIDWYMVGAEWPIRAGGVASGLVNTAAGTLLVFLPATIASALDGVRR